MKENEEKIIGQRETEDATINFLSRQAQEAILDPNLPEFFKDKIVDSAVETILKIAEKRGVYSARQEESHRVEQSHTIYKAK